MGFKLPMTEPLVVIAIHAFYRNDQASGIGAGLRFDGPDAGLAFCRRLEKRLHDYDRQGLESVLGGLAYLSPRRAELTCSEIECVIECVHWLQVREHLVADEFNGTVFACMRGKALISCECNPVTHGVPIEQGIDVTDILKASKNPCDAGTIAAVRTVVDHARKNPR